MSGNDVGIDVYGGMSLPTIYRSPSLAGVSTGWQTYGIDLSGFIGDDYLQVGWNSIWAGGNAHPTYNSYWSQVYEITDRYRVELSDGTNTWNVTSSSDLGYYPYNAADATANSLTYDDGGDASDATTNARGGVPSWDCGYNSYSFGPNRANGWAGYFYNLYRYWASPPSFPSYPSYYESAPAAFGFDWEHIDGLTPTSGTADELPLPLLGLLRSELVLLRRVLTTGLHDGCRRWMAVQLPDLLQPRLRVLHDARCGGSSDLPDRGCVSKQPDLGQDVR